MIFLQEELDWLVYHLYGLADRWLHSPPDGPARLPRGQRAFERLKGHRSFIRERGDLVPPDESEVETGSTALPDEYKSVTAEREQEIRTNDAIGIVEAYLYKRLWRDTEDNTREVEYRKKLDQQQLLDWLTERVESATRTRGKTVSAERIAADLQDDPEFQTVAQVFVASPSFDVVAIVRDIMAANAVPHHPSHVYTDAGLSKRAAWERVWDLQRREDNGEAVGEIPVPPEYSQGSRGKSKDFVRNEYWQLRGKLDVPKERFIAFSEVPDREGSDTLYGWAGWTPLQRLKTLLAIDEELEDADVPLADRIGVLDSAWRLLPDVAREDATAAGRLKAELQALVGPDGPSPELIEEWRRRFPPPTARGKRGRKAR